MQIRDRIKELRRVRAGDLKPQPKNWRVHPESQKNALRGLLAEIGYADVLLTRELLDGSLQIIDGHLRAETIAAGLSFQATEVARHRPQGRETRKFTHHETFDLARHPEKSQPTHKKLRAKDRPLTNDFVTEEAFETMLGAWFGNLARVLVPGRGFYIWGGYANIANYPAVLRAVGLYFSQTVIWVKEHPVLTRKDFMGNHEWCFYGWKEGAAHQFYGPQRRRCLVGEESQSAKYGASDREAGRVGQQGDVVLIAAR
jgi:hypothetical protein